MLAPYAGYARAAAYLRCLCPVGGTAASNAQPTLPRTLITLLQRFEPCAPCAGCPTKGNPFLMLSTLYEPSWPKYLQSVADSAVFQITPSIPYFWQPCTSGSCGMCGACFSVG